MKCTRIYRKASPNSEIPSSQGKLATGFFIIAESAVGFVPYSPMSISTRSAGIIFANVKFTTVYGGVGWGIEIEIGSAKSYLPN